MASLSLKHIYKVYDGGVKAVNDFNMEIQDKEFIVFVGPSGCGKSTTLRMIAGLEEITAGELMIGDEVVNDVEPKDRNIAMVFQNYALYPHMTVRENMEFALKLKKLPQEEIDEKVNEAAKILDIEQYLERKPRALSGGQRQRVSLGRAIVRSPKVFLLDEPLSNLDAKLRAQMRTEISKLHDKLATTFIYVTHDQVEAMTMGTRIVVMRAGCVQQIDTPQNLYNYPGNIFVAGFIGTPQMNFFEATLKKEGKSVIITFANERTITVPFDNLIKAKAKYFDGVTPVMLGIRPEDVHLDSAFVSANPETCLSTNIGIVEALGSESIVYCELDPENNRDITNTKTRLVIKVDPRTQVEKGDSITVAFDPKRLHLFDKETEMTILPRIPATNELEASFDGSKLSLLSTEFDMPEAITLQKGSYRVSIPSDAILFEGLEVEGEGYPALSIPDYDDKFAKFRKTVCAPIAYNGKKPLPLGKQIKAEVVSQENVNGKNLVELKIGDSIVFAISPVELSKNTKSVTIAIDFKRVVFTGEADKVEAFELVNTLPGKYDKEKTGKKTYNFLLKITDTYFHSTETIGKKLITASGRKVFDVNLNYDFSPYGVVFAEEGIPATVDRIVDYGTERFAVCKVKQAFVAPKVSKKAKKEAVKAEPENVEAEAQAENAQAETEKFIEVRVAIDGQQTPEGEVFLAINPYELGIVDADRDIRVL